MSDFYGNFEILRKAIDIFPRAIKKTLTVLYNFRGLGGGVTGPRVRSSTIRLLSLCHMDWGGCEQFLQSSGFTISPSHISHFSPMLMSGYLNLISCLLHYRLKEKVILNIFQYLRGLKSNVRATKFVTTFIQKDCQ